MNVLIVDDSALVRSILKTSLGSQPEFTIAGEASNGKAAIESALALKPDLILMDINMPVMDGIEATRKIIQAGKIPIVIFSTEVDAENSFKALQAGALDIIKKPDIGEFNDPHFFSQFKQRLLDLNNKAPSGKYTVKTESYEKSGHPDLIVMGASTGGPKAVQEILSHIPADFPACIALVQHLEAGFDTGYVAWLNESSALQVKIAAAQQALTPGTVYVAPAHYHLALSGSKLVTDDGPKILNQKPSVDVLFLSAARIKKEALVGVLLTGMGMDGAAGCQAVKNAGGYTIVQDEHSSAIFGMPKAAIEMGGASIILSLQEIAPYLIKIVGS
jgi:two-component system, chemotaxis family, protein-glutamate methylesterase/glutaminase